MEKIAIILATYNPVKEYFHKQIQSIQMQSWQNWICYLVDDSSHPEYQDMIREVVGGDERFILHFHGQNLGAYHNFERGLKYCLEDKNISAIAFADQDDIWLIEKLECMLKSLRANQALLVHSDLEIIDGQDRVINASAWNFERRKPTKLTVEFLLLRNVVTGCSMLFCVSLLADILPFPTQEVLHGLKTGWYHDWWVALVAAQKGKVISIPETLVKYRIHGKNTVGLTQSYGSLRQEIITWINKKFSFSDNSYIIHNQLSKAFQQRFYYRLNDWSNPFSEDKFDFGMGIILLGYRSWQAGYGSEGLVVRLWLGKLIFDCQKILNLILKTKDNIHHK